MPQDGVEVRDEEGVLVTKLPLCAGWEGPVRVATTTNDLPADYDGAGPSHSHSCTYTH